MTHGLKRLYSYLRELAVVLLHYGDEVENLV